MPTILQLLSGLPEPYSEQAIKNFNFTRVAYLQSPEVETPYDAICESFIWFKSPQGHDYWEDFSNTLEGVSK